VRLEIRKQGKGLDKAALAGIERRVRFILARFGSRISRVTVRVADLDGSCGDLRVHCRIVVRLVPFGQVSLEVAAMDLDAALEWVGSRIGPAVTRELMRGRSRGILPR
jgi:hypothetical protein